MASVRCHQRARTVHVQQELQEAITSSSSLAYDMRPIHGLPQQLGGMPLQQMGSMPPPAQLPPPTQENPTDRLISLKKLLDSGLLTQQEYEEKRAAVVAQL